MTFKSTTLIMAVVFGLTSQAWASEFVINGGFELGASGWDLVGGDAFSGPDTFSPHTGAFAYTFGNLPPAATLSQSLPTIAGQQYTISFWLQNEAPFNGEPADNAFSVFFAGNNFLSLSNATSFGYTQYSFVLTATQNNSSLAFTAYNVPAFWDLDDVSVASVSGAVPEASTWFMMLLGFAGLGLVGNRRPRFSV